MKLVLTSLALLLSIAAVRAQSYTPVDIPSAVIDQFTLSYPDAEHIHWTVQGNKYLASFKNDKKSTYALLRKDGKLLETETEIKVMALPLEATAYLVKKIDAEIESASIMENEEGVITFKAFTDDDEYWFDSNGKIFSRQADIASGLKSN
jgi:hypothetical protein